jgi:hypothetical protein
MPRNDPYMRDPNIRAAANLQLVGFPALGAGLGYAVSGWFQFATGLGVGLGALIGFVLANAALWLYGGRSTR